MVRLFAVLVRLLHSMIIASALLLLFESSISFEKFWVENGEAICCFDEAIVHLDYSVSSAPFVSKLRLWELSIEIGTKMSMSRA